ncbi:MAG: 50S ribosomal protein L9 [Patescibacteria group bacterium]
MQVILLAKVPGLGAIDDIVNVADGYATNFLFPNHLAISASPKSLNDLKTDRARRAKASEEELRTQQSLASRLDGLPVTITEKTNEAGFLYAAVTAQKISDALKKMGFDVAKNNITIKPIKEPGEYEARVKLRHGLEAKLSLVVVGLGEKK